ncbi:MAG: thiamine diphosphokinase [Bacteroidales bacterium]|jgi:thiamine pyrophosphokinase|nr:thiamine diphosphokinase [Bacteroidales bacterium]
MKPLVILADGEFPIHSAPLNQLRDAGYIVCCDGAADRLIAFGIIPDSIVGDMDSLSNVNKERFASIIHGDSCQETNDLTKAFDFALLQNPERIVILGATGIREDHSLGNISLLMTYAQKCSIPIEMWTNNGVFYPVLEDKTFFVKKRSQVSVIAFDNGVRIKSEGLKYPLDDVIFDSWWKGTLNECDEDKFILHFIEKGKIVVFITY